MNKEKNKKPLSLEETVEILGADRVEDIGLVSPDPIGMKALATKIGQRLASRGGRPTDPAWDIYRKVPMRSATWDECNAKAKMFNEEGLHLAAGQVAAFALEIGLDELGPGHAKRSIVVARSRRLVRFEFRPEIVEEAERLCTAIEDGGLW